MTWCTFFNTKPRRVKYAFLVASLTLSASVAVSLKMAFYLSDACKNEIEDAATSLGTEIYIDYLTAETDVRGHDKNITLTNIKAPVPANIVDYLTRAEKRVPGQAFNIPLFSCLVITVCTSLMLTACAFALGLYHDWQEDYAERNSGYTPF